MNVRVVLVIPVGPGERVSDTLESVRAYADPSRAIVLVDDSGGGLAGEVARAPVAGDILDVVPAPPGAPGSRGGLWVKLAAGYRHACERFRFDLLLRMDVDALMIGAGVEELALARVAEQPGLGLLGSYRIGPDGGRRDFGPAASILGRETGALGLRRPRRRALLRSLVREAEGHGYTPGEHALGGAILQPERAVRALHERGWLHLPELASSALGEDHIFGLLTVAAGFALGDLGGPGDPLALRWRGLPAHPDDLLGAGVRLTHSVRSFEDLDEAAVRARFARARNGKINDRGRNVIG